MFNILCLILAFYNFGEIKEEIPCNSFLFGDNMFTLAQVLYIWMWEVLDLTDDYKRDY